MLRLQPERRSVNSIHLGQMFGTAIASVLRAMSWQLNRQLIVGLDYMLGRVAHRRRAEVPASIESGQCARCGSHQSRRFSRNGVRPRTLVPPCRGWCANAGAACASTGAPGCGPTSA
jgi:hypothetical protein